MRLLSQGARRASVAIGLSLAGLALFSATTSATVTPVASLTTPRFGATATSITDTSGNVTSVLVVGGTSAAGGVLASAERYNVATNTWVPAGNLTTARTGAHSVFIPPIVGALASGGVLVEGGLNAAGTPVTTAELYNVATGAWSAAGSPTVARTGEALAVSGSDAILMGGINANGGIEASTERWRLGARTPWTTVGPMGFGRRNLAATSVTGNKILVTGGVDAKGNDLPNNEIYDPTAATWSPVASMATGREGHVAVPLGGGAQVLVAGGTGTAGPLTSAELYNVAANTWSSAGSMAAPRTALQQPFAGVAITPNLVEVVGGTNGRTPPTTAESWSATDGWAGSGGPGTTEALDVDRNAPTVSLLGPTSGVLIAGGYTTATTSTTRTAISLFPTRAALATPTPNATPTPTPTPTPLPQPVQSKTLIGSPSQGAVLIRIGKAKYRPLKPSESIPVGAFIDATNGYVTITGAIGAAQQSAIFWGGIFEVTQPSSEHGQIDARVIGKPVCTAAKRKAALIVRHHAVTASASKATKKKAKKKPPPRLWGDGHGSFSTKGANGAATVRGTRWLVEERCTGTYIHTARGVVTVRDYGRHKDTLLPAPRSYTARPVAKK